MIAAAGADEVSTQIAVLFGAHAEAYQMLSSRAEAFHAQFAQTLAHAANAYAATETANVASARPADSSPTSIRDDWQVLEQDIDEAETFVEDELNDFFVVASLFPAWPGTEIIP